MGWEIPFDPVLTDRARGACVNDAMTAGDGKAYALTLTGSAPETPAQLSSGIYRAWLKGRDATQSVVIALGGDEVEAEAPSSGSPKPNAVFAGDETVFVRVLPAMRYVSALVVGAGMTEYTLYLSAVATWDGDPDP